MRDDDLKNFFNEDAYNELLNAYADENDRKQSARTPRADSAAKHASAPSRAAKPQKKPPTAAEIGRKKVPPRPEPVRRQPTSHAAMESRVTDAPIRPLPPAKPAQSKENFKLEIKGLDEEFRPAPQKKQPTRSQARTPQQSGRKAPPGARAQKPGAFEGFSDIIKKRNAVQDPAAGNFMVTDALPNGERQAVILKKSQNATPADALRAFFMKNKMTWIIILVCVVVAVVLSVYTISCMNDVFAINRDAEKVVTISIPVNADTSSVLKILKENDLIEHRYFCTVFAKLMKFKDDNYLTGIYYITASMGVEKMLTTFKVAPTTGETVSLTFPEGFTVDQIVEKLEKYEVCTSAVMYQTMAEVDFSGEYSFIKDMENKEARYRMLEGYLYPDTYEFYVGENPSSVIRKFLNNFQEKWTAEYAAQAQKLGMSVDEVITLASIIQKEAFGADQSPLVSSVLHNRLNRSGVYPSLQCDSTTEYIKEYIEKNVKNSADLARYTSRYSSYQCVGLPAGAICNSGDDAIKAALYPADTSYYFFAHDVNKKLYLARNDSERRQNNLTIVNVNSKAAQNKTSN